MRSRSPTRATTRVTTIRTDRRATRPWHVAIPILVGAAVTVAACGGDAADATIPSFTGEAAEGKKVYDGAGCAACHGLAFGGGAGPTLRGLAGSTVTLSDGSTAVADTEYLRRSLVDPEAQTTKGYQLVMPRADLSAAQVESLVAMIEALGDQK